MIVKENKQINCVDKGRQVQRAVKNLLVSFEYRPGFWAPRLVDIEVLVSLTSLSYSRGHIS